jgi:hypothetical protein
MSTTQMLERGRKEEIWTKYCGFFDLSLDEFMEIQNRLLFEQIGILQNSKIGISLLGEKAPRTIEEFRSNVPITSYKQYADFLLERKEDGLPVKPYMWSRTSGRSGEYECKWVPYPKEMYKYLGEVVICAMIVSSCNYKGDVTLELNDSVLLATAPPPYVSGLLSRSTLEQMAIKFLPSLDSGEKMDFGERIATGFKMAMREGLDYFYGIASVLVRMGQQFEHGSGKSSFSMEMLHPGALSRALRGALKAKLNKRAMLPKDIWKIKGIMTGGTDTAVYKDQIEYYWGKKPLEGYACTEAGTIAVQAWNYKGMTFCPDAAFLEFIPYDEYQKVKFDPSYKPATRLMNELEPGIYELVFTNFHGGVFTRYRVGDLFEVISLRDEEIQIDLPQFRFYSRADDVIDLSGFARLTEKVIWQAIQASGLNYTDWVARKEVKDEKPFLHLYVELKSGDSLPVEEIEEAIKKELRERIPEVNDLENMLGDHYLSVSWLPGGSFSNYMKEMQLAGADLAHIKPPHMQPPDRVMQKLFKHE